jgi:hypothetical protein
MGHRIFDPYIMIATVDLSAHAQSIDPGMDLETHPDNSGPDAYRLHMIGLKVMEPKVKFFQDYASSQIDATLRPLHGTAAAVVWRANPAVKSATNPSYSATCIVKYKISGGAKGQPEMADVDLLPTTDWVIDAT